MTLDPVTQANQRYRMPTAPLGARPGVDLDRALTLVGELEDAEIMRYSVSAAGSSSSSRTRARNRAASAP